MTWSTGRLAASSAGVRCRGGNSRGASRSRRAMPAATLPRVGNRDAETPGAPSGRLTAPPQIPTPLAASDSRNSTAAATASGRTTVSGLSSSRYGAAPSRAPWLQAAAKPQLAWLCRTVTGSVPAPPAGRSVVGSKRGGRSAEPSLEALSTTTTRPNRTGPVEAASAARQDRRQSPVFQLTTTTSTAGGSPAVPVTPRLPGHRSAGSWAVRPPRPSAAARPRTSSAR
jgi:hypothetical protein